MKYSVKFLAKAYERHLTEQDFDVDIHSNKSHPVDPQTYNDYTYQQLMKQYDRLYNHVDSIEITECFLKGEEICK
jgi:hypothetical protein